ncbi:DoxX family protein [Pseudoalteromonas sp. MMG022]|uniref:DoxX family protein n=1 Tax=Pseudoalteromonas sp. MMG022 TaxID=2909978 RepID=UPI001F297466|nr:DoxX family protein [Pseudoalteromonas sp. MMG022]MCF6434514.1 DoxX family protein [Pseudoalteromonas sp. MMG022]
MNFINPFANNKQLSDLSALLGRIGLSLIFILAGINKIQQYEGTAQYMTSMGVPSELLPLVILLEAVGGLFILLGFMSRLTALAFAGFCILSAVLFHANFEDQMQAIMFMKNIAIAGGFLMLAVHGAGNWSVERIICNKVAANKQPE